MSFMSSMLSNMIFLSTPSARRATRLCVDVVHHGVAISIHALREEGDLRKGPRRRGRRVISIHALREEGDGAREHRRPRPADFYPRPPRGGRP